jgi:hypothetical protein
MRRWVSRGSPTRRVRDGAVAATMPDTQVEVFEVTPGKAYGHAKGDPFSQTKYRF